MSKTERGIAAQHLLDNSMLQECFKDLERTYTTSWRASRTVEAREDCHRYVVLIEKLKDHLTSIATTGIIERRHLDELEGQKKRVIAWPKM